MRGARWNQEAVPGLLAASIASEGDDVRAGGGRWNQTRVPAFAPASIVSESVCETRLRYHLARCHASSHFGIHPRATDLACHVTQLRSYPPQLIAARAV